MSAATILNPRELVAELFRQGEDESFLRSFDRAEEISKQIANMSGEESAEEFFQALLEQKKVAPSTEFKSNLYHFLNGYVSLITNIDDRRVQKKQVVHLVEIGLWDEVALDFDRAKKNMIANALRRLGYKELAPKVAEIREKVKMSEYAPDPESISVDVVHEMDVTIWNEAYMACADRVD